ncbi:MAG: PA14 domain-containing protein, partial [Planctomycetota bacterium]
MCSKLVYLASVILLLAVAAPQCWAVVGPVTAIETSNPPGSPPYEIVSITAGGYTVTADQLVTGTSTHGGIGGTPTPEMDDFDINTALNWNLGGGDFWTVDFGGGLWKDSNADNPDFFLFEYGGTQTPAVAAVMPDGTLGQTVTIPDQWIDLGYTRDGAAAGDAVSGSGSGQSIEGMSWAITDLLDPSGNPLTNDSVIMGISIVNRNGVDPVGFFAIRAAAILTAHNPIPANGALHEDTWINLSWSAGKGATSHDVYLADSFDDVNDRTAEAFRGNQLLDFIVAGFPGFAYPNGLVPGTTYYWRVDEVEADGTLHEGDVWSFGIPSKKATNPSPTDGASFVATDVTLGWSEGQGTKLHHLYFGESFDDVNESAAETYKGPVGTASYAPGALEMEKTYYWRIDEFDAVETHKGDVWSFTTTIPGLGAAVAMRWENIPGDSLDALKDSPRFPNNPDITETVASFEWNGPDADDYGGRIEAWLYVPASGDYTFWLATDNQGELWLSSDDDSSNTELIASVPSNAGLNNWTAFSSQKSAPIALTGGEKYYIAALWKEGSGGDHCQVAWEGPGIAAQTVIPGSNLSPFEPTSAFGAKPANRAVGVTQTPSLQWKPGLEAASHDVYFGTDADAVVNATKSSPEYIGARQLGAESYEPAMLAWSTTYYWRV